MANETPRYSPSPWARGLMYALVGLGALAYGHFSGERPLNLVKWILLGSLAVAAGIVLALLQAWARDRAKTTRG